MAITTKQQRQQRRSEALQLIADGAVFKNAGQLGFAALRNDVPAEAVVVLDLLSEGLFPSLGRHDSWFCLGQF